MVKHIPNVQHVLGLGCNFSLFIQIDDTSVCLFHSICQRRIQMDYLNPSEVLFKKTSFKEKEGGVLEMLKLMTPLITTLGMGSTMFNIN